MTTLADYAAMTPAELDELAANPVMVTPEDLEARDQVNSLREQIKEDTIHRLAEDGDLTPELELAIRVGTPVIKVRCKAIGNGWRVNLLATTGVRLPRMIDGMTWVATGHERSQSMARPHWAHGDLDKMTTWWAEKHFGKGIEIDPMQGRWY